MEAIRIELDRIDKEKNALINMRNALDIQFKECNGKWKEAIEQHDFAKCEMCEKEAKKLLAMLQFVTKQLDELENASKRVLMTVCEPFGPEFMNAILAMIDMTDEPTE
jgi:hypothetical protein